ncbi:DUF4214 domain-containing protein [Pseudomonas asiatica]|uniref:DUF4214 domain-containing protein n=1 Tax=Pseudomonas asiatica TaxID=2219225 RepID=UPI002366F2CD|nr:hypothetical protein [Pseudomonas asiatica]MDD1982355.1 hypothetical protein [Pseudomonas asiatica]
MADTDVQGMLVRIEATTAQLRQEMARGETAVAATSKNMDNSLARVDEAFDRAGTSARGMQGVIASVVSTFGGFNIAAAGSVAGLVALTQSTITHAQEVKNLSSVANASVEEFQRMAFGAKSVGVEQDKLGDILKDVNDRVGEFIQRGGGEMADFFKEIAPQVGITADQFKNLSGPQALQLYYDSLQKAGLNQQQMTTYMEQMADEATALIPLLRDGGKGFKDAGDQAEKLGLVISKFNIERLVDAGQAVRELQSTFTGVGQQIAVGLLPGIESVTASLANLRDNGGAQKLGETIGFLAENVDVLAAALGGKLAAAFAKYAIDAVASAGAATVAFVENTAATKASAIAKAEEAAASAASSAGKLREAVAAASSTKALAAEAAARVAGLTAVRETLGYQAALASGTAEEAQLKASLAATELELAAARKAATSAATAEAAASTAAAAAMARDTAATQANAVAQAEAAAAKGLLARAAGGLVGLLGGPAGIAALAIGVGVAFMTMGSNAKSAGADLADLKRSAEDVRKEFEGLTRAQQRSRIVSAIETQEAAASSADEAFADFLKTTRKVLGSTVGARIAKEAEEARKAGQDLSYTLDDWGKRFKIPEQGLRSLTQGAAAVSTLDQQTKLAGDRVALLNSEINKTAVTTQAAAGISTEAAQAASEYQKTLEKQLGTLKDKTAVEAADRYLTENKIDAQSKEGQAILATAKAIDTQKAADEAAKKAKSDANSESQKAVTLTESQAKALTDLKAQSDIVIKSSGGLADAYLAGADRSREFTLQQKVEEALLKSGAGARKEVEAAIRSQADAEDRLAVAKSAFDLAEETELLLAQARATLQGTAALEAFNVQKAMQVALTGKNIAAGSQEYDQLLAAIKAQQAAVKVAKQAADAGSIMDRLYPEKKLLREYTEGQEALNKAMELAPDKTSEYQEALRLLGLEYEQNKNAATAWGKFTEGAVDRVDGAFADAWKSIGDGFEGFASSLKEGFKQLLAELAHMAITRPIVMQIGAALGVGGLSAQTGGLFGGSAAGGGLSLSSLWNMGSSAYSAITSGFGGAIAAGWNAGQGFLGGMQGAISGGYGYISSAVSSMFSGGVAATGASNVGFGLGQSLVSGGVGSGGAAAGSSASYAAGAGGATALGGALAGIGGALYGYGKSGVKGAATGAAGGVGGYYAGAAIGSLAGPLGTVIGGVIGSALGSFVGGSLFGGSWQTKDVGLSLGVTGGEFEGQQYEYQKKKGGLFGKNKKRTRYSALDPKMQTAMQETFDATEDTVVDLLDRIGVSVGDGAFAGLNIARQKISTKGKSASEIQEEIAKLFSGFGDQMIAFIDQGVGGFGYSFTELGERIAVFESFNKSLGLINVTMLGLSAQSMELANAMVAAAGGLETYTNNLNTYFNAFFSETERADKTLASVQRQFKDMNVVLPETREGYRKVVEALDLTTESGQQMYLTLMAASGAAAQAYDILEAKSQQAAAELASTIQAGVNSAIGAVQRAVNAQKTALTDAYNAQIASLTDMSQTAQKNVSDLAAAGGSLSRALKALRGHSDDAVKVLRAQALATLNSALATVKAGKSLAGTEGLDDALDVVGQNSRDAYSSLEAYNRDQGRTANIVSALEAANGKQLSAAEKTVNSLQTQVEQAKKAYDLQIAQYDAQLSLAQAQIDALNGVDNSVISVAAAVDGLSHAVVAALKIADDGAAKQNTYDNNAAIVRAVYRNVLGRDAEVGGLASWTEALSGGGLTYDDLVSAIATAGRANGETIRIPGFANGGSFGGGLRLVGERGPELEVTGPSRIYNANQTAAMLAGGAGDVTAAEVRELRVELKSALFAIAKHTLKVAKNTDLLPQKLEQELYP